MPRGIRPLGNLATEDIVYLLNEMGIETGIDTDGAIAASRDIAEMLGIEPVGHVACCGSRSELIEEGQKSLASNQV